MGLFSCFTGCGVSKAKELVGTVAEPIEKKRFLEAAKDGNEDRFSACLEEHPDLLLSHSLANGKTAAHLASESGHVHILEVLTESLLCNASKICGKEGSGQEPAEAILPSLINAMDAEGRTPLSLASEHGHVDCARFLLANGADRLIADHKGNTTLHYASWKCHLGIMFMLLGDFTEDPQTQAEMAMAREQAGQSAPNSTPASQDRLSSLNESRSSQRPSHLPPEASQTAAARLVNMQNLFGFAPLQYASWSKQPAVVQVLLQYGADMLIKNPRAGTEHSILCAAGSTPLHLAAFRGHIEISRILLKTFYERFLEPMLLAQAGTGVDAATITRSVRAHDPRTQVNALNLLPHQVAHRLGFLALSMLLKPNIPILRLFSEDERAVRLYGPPQLKVLCAEALNRKLLTALEQLSNNPPPKPVQHVAAVPAPAAITTAPSPPLSPSMPHPPPLVPRTSMQHARHPSNGLPTVPEADDEMTTATNMSRETLANPAGDHGPNSSVKSALSTPSVQSTPHSQSFTPAQPASPRGVSVHLQGNSFLGAPRGGSQEVLQAMFVPPNAVQQQQQQQQQQEHAHMDGASPVHSLVENVAEAPSLDLWQYPEQPRPSPAMPNPGPSPFAAMAAAPPSRASLEANSQHTALTPPHAHTTSTVSSGGAAPPPELGAVISSAAAAAAAAVHVDPKAAVGPHAITTSRLPGQATSSCEQNVHARRSPMMEGPDSSSLLLPTPPASSGTSSPVFVLHSGGGTDAQPQQHSSAAGQASTPASAAAVAGSLLHSPVPVGRGDVSAYGPLLGGNNTSMPLPSTNQAPSPAGVPLGHARFSLPNINVARPSPHPAQDDALPSRDSPASNNNPHSLQPSGHHQQHFWRHSAVQACPDQPSSFSPPGGYQGSGSGIVTSAPEQQFLSARQSASGVTRLETATSNPIPGQKEGGPDAASQLYRSASTATNGDNTAPNSPPTCSAGGPGNGPFTGRSGSGFSGLFRTNSPPRNTSPFQKLRHRNPPPGRTGGVTDPGAGPGPSTSQAAGSGSLRGGLRGLLHPQDRSARGSDKGARGRTSRSGSLRRKRSGPSDPLASDVQINPDDNPDNDEAHDALNVECGIHNEGITDTPRHGGALGPRVFMSTQGSTITLSHTPSMPMVDQEVVEAATVARSNSGQLHRKEAGITSPTSCSNSTALPSSSEEGLVKKVKSSPILASLVMVPQHEEHPQMYASPLFTQLSADGSLASPSTPHSTPPLNRLPRQYMVSSNQLYSGCSTGTGLGLPGDVSKTSSTSQLLDPAAVNAPEEALGGATFNMITSAGVDMSSGPTSPQHNAGVRDFVSSPQNSGPMGAAKSGTLLVQRSIGRVPSSRSGSEVLSAAELPTLDGQAVVSEAPGAAGVSRPDGAGRSSVGPSTLDVACELGKPADVVPEAALYQVEEVEEECGVCMESMASLRLLPCTHTICGPCAHRMCSMFIQRTPHCPFCRSIIADVTAYYMPFLPPNKAALVKA